MKIPIVSPEMISEGLCVFEFARESADSEYLVRAIYIAMRLAELAQHPKRENHQSATLCDE